MSPRRWWLKLRTRWFQIFLVSFIMLFMARDAWHWYHGYECTSGEGLLSRGRLSDDHNLLASSHLSRSKAPNHTATLSQRTARRGFIPHIGSHSPVKLTRLKKKPPPKARKSQTKPPKKPGSSKSRRREEKTPSPKSPRGHSKPHGSRTSGSSHPLKRAGNRTIHVIKFPKRDAKEEKLPLEEVFLRKLHRQRVVRGLPVPSMRENKTCSPSLNVNSPCVDRQCAASWNGSRDLTSFRQFMQEQPEVPEKYMDAISEMGREDNSRRYQLMIVMAVSSNHFLEVQALLHNLHTLVLPALANVDHVLVLYDLGLTPHERQLMIKYCRCQVRSFSLAAFPEKLQSLRCYVWKPILIGANLPYTQHLLWLDASTRFISDDLTPIFTELEKSGFLMSRSCWGLAYNVHPSMLKFYRMPPACALSDFFEWEANVLALASTKLTMATILGPWLACTFAPDCMCPPGHEKFFKSPPYRAYSKCHRFDQSSLNMILLRLYGDRMPLLTFPRYIYHTIKRSTIMHYFPEK